MICKLHKVQNKLMKARVVKWDDQKSDNQGWITLGKLYIMYHFLTGKNTKFLSCLSVGKNYSFADQSFHPSPPPPPPPPPPTHTHTHTHKSHVDHPLEIFTMFTSLFGKFTSLKESLIFNGVQSVICPYTYQNFNPIKNTNVLNNSNYNVNFNENQSSMTGTDIHACTN